MATQIRGLQIKDAFFGVGLKRNAVDGNVAELTLNELTAAVVSVANDSIAIIDADDSNSSKKESIVDFVAAIAGSGLTAASGQLSVSALTGNIVESDIIKEDESSNCNGITTDFTLANIPLSSSVQVFLNGSLLREGSGIDYTLDGTTVSFVLAPETGDYLIIYYIIDNA